MIPKLVYILCALTSIGCATLLLKSYSRSGTRLLFWSGLCFVFMGLSNVILFVDLVLTATTTDLSIYRTTATFIGVAMLVYGLISEAP